MSILDKLKLVEGVSARNHTIKAILTTLTEKHELERINSERVSNICYMIGEKMGLNKDSLKELKLSGLFHDIGKISIPDSILFKPDKLSKEEYEIIKDHTKNGYQILRAADEYSDFAEHALYHHEKMDGSGYPDGLKGKDIPLFARIISVADAYEAMTSDRPYRKALPVEKAMQELETFKGTQFDKKIVDIFIQMLSDNPALMSTV
ncbi:MAG: HD-GYP domain-containing protein [Candidatus Izemoplasmataceae bacterium]